MALAATANQALAVEDPSTLVAGSPGEAYVARYIGELFDADIAKGDPLDEVRLGDRVADVAVTMRTDPAMALQAQQHREQNLRVAQETLARQIRLDALSEESELRKARNEATRKLRAITQAAEADGKWTQEELAEYDALHDQWSEIWQFTPEEEVALEASNESRQNVFNEIRKVSRNLGLMSPLAMYDSTDKPIYLFHGGLEPLMYRNGDQLEPLDASEYFKDEKLIREAAGVAASPL